MTRVMAQVGMVMNLDKCIGCHTCSVTCKQTWTNRSGVEYVWFNNVETRPGLGYPRRARNLHAAATMITLPVGAAEGSVTGGFGLVVGGSTSAGRGMLGPGRIRGNGGAEGAMLVAPEVTKTFQVREAAPTPGTRRLGAIGTRAVLT